MQQLKHIVFQNLLNDPCMSYLALTYVSVLSINFGQIDGVQLEL